MKNKYILGAVILLGGLVTVFAWPKGTKNLYETEIVKRQDVEQLVSVTGTVTARRTIPLRMKVPGQVQEIFVESGQKVEKGDVLLKIDSQNFEIEVQQAQARVAIAQANLDQRLAGVTSEDLNVSQKQIDNAQAHLKAAEQRLESLKKTITQEQKKAQLDIEIAQTRLKDSNTQFTNTRESSQTRLEIAQENLTFAYENTKTPFSNALLESKKTLTQADNLLGISQKRGYKNYYFGDSILETQAQKNYKNLKEITQNTEKKREDLKIPDDRPEVLQLLTESENMIQQAQTLAENLYDLLETTQTTSLISESQINQEINQINALQSTLSQSLSGLKTSRQTIQNAALEVENTQKSIQASHDNAREGFNQTQSALSQAQENFNLLKINHQKMLENAEAEIEIARTQLQQVQASYKLKNSTPRNVDLAALRAQLESEKSFLALAEKKLKDTQMVAPIQGIITRIDIDPGENINTTQDLLEIMDEELYILANVSETDIAKITPEQKVEITFDALNLNDVFYGKIQKIDPAQTVVQGVIYYQIESNFENDGRIRPGMTANLDIQTGNQENTLAVSPQTIIYEDKKPFIRVLNDQGEVEKRYVTLGLEGDLKVEILEGLEEGEEIVVFEIN